VEREEAELGAGCSRRLIEPISRRKLSPPRASTSEIALARSDSDIRIGDRQRGHDWLELTHVSMQCAWKA